MVEVAADPSPPEVNVLSLTVEGNREDHSLALVFVHAAARLDWVPGLHIHEENQKNHQGEQIEDFHFL